MKSSVELKAEIAALEAQRDDITSQIRAKNIAYLGALNAESPYKKGEKVRLFREAPYPKPHKKLVGEGIFIAIDFSYGKPFPKFNKVKKDGTASLNVWSKYDFDHIEKIEQ